MKAGWIFTPNVIVNGVNTPYFPAGVSAPFSTTNPVEIHRLTGSTHVHLLVNGLALANDFKTAHEHYAIRADGIYFQAVKGDVAAHIHDDDETPAWFMPFVICSDADAALIAADPACHVVAFCPIDEETGAIGEEDNTAWSAGERTAWETRFSTVLGITLPAEISNGRRLVLFMFGIMGRRYSEAQPLRPTISGINSQ